VVASIYATLKQKKFFKFFDLEKFFPIPSDCRKAGAHPAGGVRYI
jgi:hypothetical protein